MTKPTNDELKPCPFCGGSGVWMSYPCEDKKRIWFIFCSICGACGSEVFSKKEAIDAWNHRPERKTE